VGLLDRLNCFGYLDRFGWHRGGRRGGWRCGCGGGEGRGRGWVEGAGGRGAGVGGGGGRGICFFGLVCVGICVVERLCVFALLSLFQLDGRAARSFLIPF